MFVLNSQNELFLGKYILVDDVQRKGYWMFFKKSISFCEYPVYKFNWVHISEKEFEERFPKHFLNFRYHRFLFDEKLIKVAVNKSWRVT